MSAQGAGGDTAWLRAFDAGARPVGLARGASQRVVVALGPDEDTTSQLIALAPAGTSTWSDALAGSCAVTARPIGATTTGALAVLATAPCTTIVSGLGPDPLGPEGAVLLLDAGGAPAGRLGRAADLAAAPLVEAVTTSTGEVAVLTRASTPTVTLVGADGTERWRWELTAARHVLAAPAGDVVVTVGSAPVQLIRIRHDGGAAWARDLPAAFSSASVAVLTDGAIAAVGTVSEPVSWGRGSAGTRGGEQVAVLVVEPDGTPRTAADVDGASPGPATPVLVALPHGRLLLARFARCELLRALSPQLEPVWERNVDAGCAVTVRTAVVSDAGQIAIAGTSQGRADFGSGYVLDAPGGAQTPFVLALWP